MEQCCGPLAVEKIPGYTAISASILPREREISLAHAPRCNFLFIEHSCGPIAVEIFPGKHYYFSTYLAKRARAQSGACAEVQFHDYGTVLWSPLRGKFLQESRKALRFHHLFCQEKESSVWSMRRGADS
jgi:hypothetical protein